MPGVSGRHNEAVPAMTTLDIRVAFSAIDKLTRPATTARRSAGALAESLRRTQANIKNLIPQAKSFSRLRDAFAKTNTQIQKAQRELGGLQAAQRSGAILTEKQQTLMTSLAARLERLNEVRAREKERLREATRAMTRHGISLAGGDRTIESAIRRTEQYNRQLAREQQMLAAVTRARQRYEQAQQLAGRLRGRGAMAIGAATAAGYGAGRFLAPAVGFDQKMARVQSLTRIDKDNPQFAALREQAKKLGAETAFSASDAASGQAFLAMAGFTPQAIRAALPGVLNMALAGGMELGESADIGSNVLSQFNLNPKEMNRVSDVLTATFTRTNTDLRGIGEAMTYAGVGAEKLGISVEETAALVGMLAQQGIRGSMAGTGLRATLGRLAAPADKARTALKELGVSAADAQGKMRPITDVLLDLYNATRKYSNTAQASFFKDIAGEEAFTSLQTLVDAAGKGNLQALLKELEAARGEAGKVARVMADNLGGDLDNLSSAWEGLRIQIEEVIDGGLRKLTQQLSDVITRVSDWAKANPTLARTVLVLGGSLLALTAAMGALSLAAGVLIGPVAKLQLGFSLLMGTKGLGRTIPIFSRLAKVVRGPLGGLRGWSAVLRQVTGGLGRLGGILPALRGLLVGAFLSPGGALLSLGRGIGSLLLRLTGLPALWSMITTGASLLGGAISVLLSPVGLLAAAFVAAGVLIWKYWEPIKAFFEGFITGVMAGIAPIREAFAPFVPIFSQIGDAIKSVWEWFTRLFEPVNASKDTLEKCTSAGETFGRVVGAGIQALLTPATLLMDALGWILEKLGMIPDGIEQARQKAEALQAQTLLKGKVDALQATVQAIAPAQPAAQSTLQHTTIIKAEDKPGHQLLNRIANNTSDQLKETRKRIGPGDIVFRNLPRALAVRGEWREPTDGMMSGRSIGLAGVPTVAEVRTEPALASAGTLTKTEASGMPSIRNDSISIGDIHVHLHGVTTQDPQALAKMVGDAVRAELERQARARRGSYRDAD